MRAVHSLPGRGGGGGGTPPAPAPTTYVQTFVVPDTTWSVTHNLGTQTPEVTCYSPTGQFLGDADARVLDNNTVVITWAVPVAGRAKIGI